MLTHPDEIREKEMVAMARRDPELFNELWEKGAYNPANNAPDIIGFFSGIFKKAIAIFKRKT